MTSDSAFTLLASAVPIVDIRFRFVSSVFCLPKIPSTETNWCAHFVSSSSNFLPSEYTILISRNVSIALRWASRSQPTLIWLFENTFRAMFGRECIRFVGIFIEDKMMKFWRWKYTLANGTRRNNSLSHEIAERNPLSKCWNFSSWFVRSFVVADQRFFTSFADLCVSLEIADQSKPPLRYERDTRTNRRGSGLEREPNETEKMKKKIARWFVRVAGVRIMQRIATFCYEKRCTCKKCCACDLWRWIFLCVSSTSSASFVHSFIHPFCFSFFCSPKNLFEHFLLSSFCIWPLIWYVVSCCLFAATIDFNSSHLIPTTPRSRNFQTATARIQSRLNWTANDYMHKYSHFHRTFCVYQRRRASRKLNVVHKENTHTVARST